MHDMHTPEQALEIAAAATRQARDAAELPTWGPVAAGLLAGLGVALFGVAEAQIDFTSALNLIGLIGGTLSLAAFFAVSRWLARVRRERGLVPAPVSMWKVILVVVVLAPMVPMLGLAFPALYGWLCGLAGVIAGGWIWMTQARPRTMPWIN
ncbi:hypothetical protein AB0L82_37900 [Nocardia sp. NPDC052001]|uniref:hypothetical protein n=1 Tax=Nocardia sp. NPDC052001 TaxID=3154853 RepID=UPI00343511EC